MFWTYSLALVLKIPSRWPQRPGPEVKGVQRCHHRPDSLKCFLSIFFKVVMVMFVGGCTMAEVAALRFLSQQVMFLPLMTLY